MPERAELRAAFVDWLGRINAERASIAWWAHAVSAKNLLSSPFGNEVLGRLTGQDGRGESPAAPGLLTALPRMLYQLLRVCFAWALWMRGRRQPASAAEGIHVLTYADAGVREDNDAFFGPLAALLRGRTPPLACRFHAFIHGEYGAVLAKLETYRPLFAELRFVDLIASFAGLLAAWRRQWPAPAPLRGLDLGPLLRAELRRDLASGGYFLNLLVYHAARRLGGRLRPARFLYPYENKSLEKLLLLGLREAHPAVRIVGYQHTSVTPRHTTLLFAEGEAARTPLPDRIVTCGAVTRGWLEAHGRYPGGLLVEGPALRQRTPERLERRKAGRAEGMRVLFALSSSAEELFSAARLLREAAEARPAWHFALRPHPEFPLSLLPAELMAKARDLSGTALADNLAWADAVVYASSTVALEALMAGRPVVALDLGEPLEVDPVLEPVSLHWRARNAEELVRAIEEIAALGDDDHAARAREARDFTERYFRAPTAQGLEVLVRMPPR